MTSETARGRSAGRRARGEASNQSVASRPGVRISVVIDPERHRRLKIHAAECETTITRLIVGFVDSLLKDT